MFDSLHRIASGSRSLLFKRNPKHNINLKCYIDDELPDFEPYSFNIIFGILMDNAIEAENGQINKEIRISIDTFSSYIHLIVQTRISCPVLINGEMPSTSKDDEQNHGIGLINVKEIQAFLRIRLFQDFPYRGRVL